MFVSAVLRFVPAELRDANVIRMCMCAHVDLYVSKSVYLYDMYCRVLHVYARAVYLYCVYMRVCVSGGPVDWFRLSNGRRCITRSRCKRI